MKKQQIKVIGMLLMASIVFGGCNGKNAESTSNETNKPSATTSAQNTDNSDKADSDKADDAAKVADGTYMAKFDTDSTMFHVNEACEGKGKLTVKDGKMTIHISLTSKNILNLYCGLAKDAQKEDADVLNPTVDTVTYSDGTTEEVNGFDVPVNAIDEEFDLALIGTKGKWYDHKVKVTDLEPMDDNQTQDKISLEDGNYTAEITFEGGSGKAKILSPVTLKVSQGKVTASLEWSSPNYDYMIVDGNKYQPVNSDGNSVFEIPVSDFDKEIKVIGDTVAMSKPHEIEYTLTFNSDTIKTVK